MTFYYKSLDSAGKGLYSGLQWSLPVGGNPGDWMASIVGALSDGSSNPVNGYFISGNGALGQLMKWDVLGSRLFKVEVAVETITFDEVVVTRRARLLWPEIVWTDKERRLYLADVTENVVGKMHALLVINAYCEGPDVLCQPGGPAMLAVAAARAYADAGITKAELAAARAAAEAGASTAWNKTYWECATTNLQLWRRAACAAWAAALACWNPDAPPTPRMVAAATRMARRAHIDRFGFPQRGYLPEWELERLYQAGRLLFYIEGG
jgi:hypothetical protein